MTFKRRFILALPWDGRTSYSDAYSLVVFKNRKRCNYQADLSSMKNQVVIKASCKKMLLFFFSSRSSFVLLFHLLSPLPSSCHLCLNIFLVEEIRFFIPHYKHYFNVLLLYRGTLQSLSLSSKKVLETPDGTVFDVSHLFYFLSLLAVLYL